jgi:hypothetical protein
VARPGRGRRPWCFRYGGRRAPVPCSGCGCPGGDRRRPRRAACLGRARGGAGARPRGGTRRPAAGAAERCPYARLRRGRRRRDGRPGRASGAAGRGVRAGEPRRLGDIAAEMLERVPRAVVALVDPAGRRLPRDGASAVAELVGEPGTGCCTGTCATAMSSPPSASRGSPSIPSPSPGTPASVCGPLESGWDGIVATGDPARAVRRRFDLLTEVLGPARRRAAGWTAAAERVVGHRGRRAGLGSGGRRPRALRS